MSSFIARNWLKDPSTWPVMAVVAGACTMGCVFGFRKVVYDPDVNFERNDRVSINPSKHQQELAATWAKQENGYLMPALNKVSTLNKAFTIHGSVPGRYEVDQYTFLNANATKPAEGGPPKK